MCRIKICLVKVTQLSFKYLRGIFLSIECKIKEVLKAFRFEASIQKYQNEDLEFH